MVAPLQQKHHQIIMESSSKVTEEKRILEQQIKTLSEAIENEIKAQIELSARLKCLEDKGTRQKELEEVFNKTYGEKLGQFDKMFEKMKLLKEKLEESARKTPPK